MTITYQDSIEAFLKFYKDKKENEKQLSVELSAPLKIPSALESVQMLDDVSNTLNKVMFVYNMLMDNGVVIKHNEEILCSFSVNKGMTFEDVDYFRQHPAIYRFFLDSVFGIFLKNSYPLLSESQEADQN